MSIQGPLSMVLLAPNVGHVLLLQQWQPAVGVREFAGCTAHPFLSLKLGMFLHKQWLWALSWHGWPCCAARAVWSPQEDEGMHLPLPTLDWCG